jgi:hypothetical protein
MKKLLTKIGATTTLMLAALAIAPAPAFAETNLPPTVIEETNNYKQSGLLEIVDGIEEVKNEYGINTWFVSTDSLDGLEEYDWATKAVDTMGIANHNTLLLFVAWDDARVGVWADASVIDTMGATALGEVESLLIDQFNQGEYVLAPIEAAQLAGERFKAGQVASGEVPAPPGVDPVDSTDEEPGATLRSVLLIVLSSLAVIVAIGGAIAILVAKKGSEAAPQVKEKLAEVASNAGEKVAKKATEVASEQTNMDEETLQQVANMFAGVLDKDVNKDAKLGTIRSEASERVWKPGSSSLSSYRSSLLNPEPAETEPVEDTNKDNSGDLAGFDPTLPRLR